MSARIEDYALIGDCHTAALVARNGSIDWLCLPRFDSPACFASLIGNSDHGHWQVSPASKVKSIRRQYREGTLILETTYETEEGEATLIDFMPPRGDEMDLVRIVKGVRGRVPMTMELALRFDYGSIIPWVRKTDFGIRAVAGPDTVLLSSDVPLHGENFTTQAEFTVSEGEQVSFVLLWHPSHENPRAFQHCDNILYHTEDWWREWSDRCTYEGQYREAIVRSLVTLKALTYAPTGGIAAAPTTSLPELIGGQRNWDYRYCWIRDASFTLAALLAGGYKKEARAWREWLLRAVAGMPSQLNLMYGLAGERRLPELELDWLPGYEGSTPVRIGNGAWKQFQLDVFGELIETLHLAATKGIDHDENAWRVQRELGKHLESVWTEPDEGIWEVRGPQQHFTHSKMMAWVAFDRLIKNAELLEFEGPIDRWKSLRKKIHKEVCEKGFDANRNTFTQHYGSDTLDASLLMMPLVGFLPADDPRVLGTVEAIEKALAHDGFLRRYTPSEVDGIECDEGAFLLCSFWLVDNYALQGRKEEATELFERLLSLRNDVGLLSEEYDPEAERLLGNFPQAFSHIGLVNSAFRLSQM